MLSSVSMTFPVVMGDSWAVDTFDRGLLIGCCVALICLGVLIVDIIEKKEEAQNNGNT